MNISSSVPTICFISRDCCLNDLDCVYDNDACNERLWESISEALLPEPDQPPEFNLLRVKYSQFVNFRPDSVTLGRLVREAAA